MPRWEVIISDAFTGKLVADGVTFKAGRSVTADPAVAAWLASADVRYVAVREIAEGEESGEAYEAPAPPQPKAPLTRADLRGGNAPATEPCFECGVEFADKGSHAAQSGHQVTESVTEEGGESLEEAGDGGQAV